MGCFVAYGDTNASSPLEDAYRGRDFSTDGVTHPAFYDAQELAALALSLAGTARRGQQLGPDDGDRGHEDRQEG